MNRNRRTSTVTADLHDARARKSSRQLSLNYDQVRLDCLQLNIMRSNPISQPAQCKVRIHRLRSEFVNIAGQILPVSAAEKDRMDRAGDGDATRASKLPARPTVLGRRMPVPEVVNQKF